jgi:mannose-6-phosphate isomerase-like protein (cupin superfamily)
MNTNLNVLLASHSSCMQRIKIVPKEWGEERWIVNRAYCGKILLLKKGYRCSLHHHKVKDETFYISKGCVLLECDGKAVIMNPGDALLIQPNSKHRFTGLQDSEIFEFSTHHEDSDSYRDELSGKVDLSTLSLPTPKATLSTG